MHAVIEGALDKLHERRTLRKRCEAGRFARAVARQHDPARQGSLAWKSATLAAGGCTWTTDPLSVSCTTGLMAASVQKRLTTVIESFLRLIGRGMGTTSRRATSIKASSSESSRQPRATKAAHSVLFLIPVAQA